MANRDLVFVIKIYEKYHDDYCDTCQQLGSEQTSGLKTHRNFPTDVRNVDVILVDEDPDFETPLAEYNHQEALMCGDCLAKAQEDGYRVFVKPLDLDMDGKELPVPENVEDYPEWDRKGLTILRKELRTRRKL